MTTKTLAGAYLLRCTRCKTTRRVSEQHRAELAAPENLWNSKYGFTTCEGCRGTVRYVPIVATLGVKECGGVCMGAVGPSCDCKCKGENHGRNHGA